ncbi:hypothetical protein BDV95DRAFT_356575 [Massariosphaeria phaeospora]|uniref:Uncharacterized protein n=1 Tax=Massariosphaeria phaeospora TaxID=100035 RepID=A0A7C8IBH5_9PLEO|nr:hypothetical protein BDV95DRAFT_356575 [Massariosphaeria phaeospora]
MIYVKYNDRRPRGMLPPTWGLKSDYNLHGRGTISGTSPNSSEATSQTIGSPEYSVVCPYDCGTVLTGVRAVGNLTRYPRSQTCGKSGRGNVEYPCPIPDCGRQYSRSDSLKGAPPTQTWCTARTA